MSRLTFPADATINPIMSVYVEKSARKEIMPKYTAKLPVIDSRNGWHHSPQSRRQGPKLSTYQIASTNVRPSPHLPPLVNPGRQREARQMTFNTRRMTFNTRQGQGNKLRKYLSTSDTIMRPSPRLPPLANLGIERETTQITFKADTNATLPKIQARPNPTPEEQTGNVDYSEKYLKLEYLKKKLLRETEREEELKSLQTEDERYLNHLGKNSENLKQEAERMMRKTKEISSTNDNVRETLKCLKKDIEALGTKKSELMYRSQRFRDACAKLEAEVAREVSEAGRQRLSMSGRSVDQTRTVPKKAFARVIRCSEEGQIQAGAPQNNARVKAKSKGHMDGLADKILNGKKGRPDPEVDKSRSESPIQFIRRKSQKFIRIFKRLNCVTPIPEED